jgi:hypothetical protein
MIQTLLGFGKGQPLTTKPLNEITVIVINLLMGFFVYLFEKMISF